MTATGGPSLIDRSRSSYDLVLGSAFGAYIGLTVSRDGLGGGEALNFALLLLFACGFVLGLNNGLQEAQKSRWTLAVVWSFTSAVSWVFLFNVSGNFGLNLDVLAAIGGVWITIALADVVINLVLRRMAARPHQADKEEN